MDAAPLAVVPLLLLRLVTAVTALALSAIAFGASVVLGATTDDAVHAFLWGAAWFCAIPAFGLAYAVVGSFLPLPGVTRVDPASSFEPLPDSAHVVGPTRIFTSGLRLDAILLTFYAVLYLVSGPLMLAFFAGGLASVTITMSLLFSPTWRKHRPPGRLFVAWQGAPPGRGPYFARAQDVQERQVFD